MPGFHPGGVDLFHSSSGRPPPEVIFAEKAQITSISKSWRMSRRTMTKKYWKDQVWAVLQMTKLRYRVMKQVAGNISKVCCAETLGAELLVNSDATVCNKYQSVQLARIGLTNPSSCTALLPTRSNNVLVEDEVNHKVIQ